MLAAELPRWELIAKGPAKVLVVLFCFTNINNPRLFVVLSFVRRAYHTLKSLLAGVVTGADPHDLLTLNRCKVSKMYYRI